ncbi:MAG: hypothetical protein DMD83_02620 [Candidatus Rokuibacteriota bacterium]|nr:MAG: hypothetical protein DMD83_02620 [Candidatus Rokubacteria bacterium]
MTSVGRIARLLVRGLFLRCPHCGVRGVTRRWVQVRATCPRCGLRLDRGEPDYWVGAMAFNQIGAELLLAVGLAAVLWLTWPTPPWDAMLWGGIPVLVAFPIVTYPMSKLIWLGFDLIFRPLRPTDFAAVAAAVPAAPAPSAENSNGEAS